MLISALTHSYQRHDTRIVAYEQAIARLGTIFKRASISASFAPAADGRSLFPPVSIPSLERVAIRPEQLNMTRPSLTCLMILQLTTFGYASQETINASLATPDLGLLCFFPLLWSANDLRYGRHCFSKPHSTFCDTITTTSSRG